MLPLAMATNCGKTREHKLDEQRPSSLSALIPHDSQLITAISSARQAGRQAEGERQLKSNTWRNSAETEREREEKQKQLRSI